MYDYNHGFYLNSVGKLIDINERSNLVPGGYLCKKYRTASFPARVGYNLGYCFPSLTSGSCPAGWSQYSPSSTFCYYMYTGGYWTHDETFRQCHQMGADLVYIENAAEFNWLKTNGYIQGTYNTNKLNGHAFRYGPGTAGSGHPLYWSNGVSVINGQFGLFNYCSGEFNDYCNKESYLDYYYSENCLNDGPGFVNHYNVNINGYDNGVGSCKRPKCGVILIYCTVLYFGLFVHMRCAFIVKTR